MKKYVFVVGFSEFASRMNFMALSILILSFQNAVWYLTVFFISRQVGGILTSLIAGRLVDKYDRRKIMIWSDGINAIGVLLPIFIFHPIAVCFSAFILGCTYQTFYVSYSSSIPDMFGQARSTQINALIVRLSSVVSIIGFLFGGWITEYLGHIPVILFDSFTYLTATIYLFTIRWNSKTFNANETRTKTNLFTALKGNRKITFIIVTAFFYTLAVSANNYSLPLLASSFTLDAFTNGLFWAAGSAGAFIGTFFQIKNKSLSTYLLILQGFAAAMILVFLASEKPNWIMICLFLAGAFEGISQVKVNTIIQNTASYKRGKAFALLGLFSRIGFFFGFFICPILVSSFSLKVNVWSLNGLLVIWTIFVYLLIWVGDEKWKKRSTLS